MPVPCSPAAGALSTPETPGCQSTPHAANRSISASIEPLAARSAEASSLRVPSSGDIMIEMVMMQAVVPADWDGEGPITVQTAWGPMRIAVPEGFSIGQQFSFQMANPIVKTAVPSAQPAAQMAAKPATQAAATPGQVQAPQPQVMVFDRKPKLHTCQHCKRTAMTEVHMVTGTGTHLVGLCLCLVSPCCCCIPYCCDTCKCGQPSQPSWATSCAADLRSAILVRTGMLVTIAASAASPLGRRSSAKRRSTSCAARFPLRACSVQCLHAWSPNGI